MGRIGGVSRRVPYCPLRQWLLVINLAAAVNHFMFSGQYLLLQLSGNLTMTHKQTLNYKFAILLL